MTVQLLLFNLATDADDPLLGFTTMWISELAKHMKSIHVVTMKAGRLDVPSNVHVYSVGKEKGYSEPRRAIEFYRHLSRIFLAGRPDACFSHMIPLFTVMAGPILRMKKIPIITWYAHSSMTTMLKLAHHLSDRMVTIFPTAYPYKHDKLAVIGQGIDTDLFSPDGSEPEDPPMVLCVGRISPVKNHPILLKASALIKNNSSKLFQVVIVGNPATPKDGEYLASLQKMVRDLKIEDVVRFVPAIPGYKLPTWYRRCTVHVNMTPSGSGDKVALEAMSCGRLCLVSNVGFMETLGKYSTEYMFENHFDLALKLSRILDLNYINRLEVEKYNRHQIVKMHSLSNISRELLKLYSSL